MAEKRKTSRDHAKIERLSIFGATAHFSPVGLIVFAGHYLAAAKTAKVPEDTPPTGYEPARTFLACRSIELSLAAFLSLKGILLEKLAGGAYGHNLESLVAEVEKLDTDGLVSFSASQRFQIMRAATYYSAKVFEYPALGEAVGAYPEYPNTEILIETAANLFTSLHDPCVNAT